VVPPVAVAVMMFPSLSYPVCSEGVAHGFALAFDVAAVKVGSSDELVLEVSSRCAFRPGPAD
jgi:hypothetical protein